MRFYLGTHEVGWLAQFEVPLFVSHRRLRCRARLPRARGRWALDSGGFTELATYHGWSTGPVAYVSAVRRYRDEIGGLDWAAPQDWMCEHDMVAGTGLSVAEHQRRTVANVVELRSIAPDLPFIPVLQGWSIRDYLACVDLYAGAGVDLRAEPVVGLGSVCRRQSTSEIAQICEVLAWRGLRLHGFGVKTTGLRRYGGYLASADSMAWSYNARRHPGLAGHTHRNCSNCPTWALRWRDNVIAATDANPPTLWDIP